jgi:F-type H+-transporting ATPase subunit b
MDLNVTLGGQIITFIVCVFVTMKYIWPHITKAMQEREQRIADGLAAADKGQHDLQLAKNRSVEILQEAKNNALQIINQANQRSAQLLEEAKANAVKEGERMIDIARLEIEQQVNHARRELQQQVAALAVGMAEKIVQRDIDMKNHQPLLDKLVTEI